MRLFNSIIIAFFTYLTLLECFDPGGLGHSSQQEPMAGTFLDELKSYMLSYYSSAKIGTVKAEEVVIKDMMAMADRWFGLKEGEARIRDVAGLGVWLDEKLRPYGKTITIFSVNGSSIINCWAGDLLEEKLESRDVWGRQVRCIVKTMDKAAVQDFDYFSSGGKEALDIGTRNGIVYINLEAYRIRGAAIWDFFADREGGYKKRRYDPSRSNRLRKKLHYKIWSVLYSDCIKKYPNREKAKKIFIEKAVTLLKENSLFHEMGHVFAEERLRIKDEKEEEIIALLTELKFGPLPYESLDMTISASYQNSITVYNIAGREILSSFISYIEAQQRLKNPEYNDIDIKKIGKFRRMDNLFKLTEDQIRSISEHIFQERKGWGRFWFKNFCCYDRICLL